MRGGIEICSTQSDKGHTRDDIAILAGGGVELKHEMVSFEHLLISSRNPRPLRGAIEITQPSGSTSPTTVSIPHVDGVGLKSVTAAENLPRFDCRDPRIGQGKIEVTVSTSPLKGRWKVEVPASGGVELKSNPC
jgi:hypothetical protein